MRIAINTLAMKRQLYGVGNYIKHLVLELSKLDSRNEYVLFVTTENQVHLDRLGDNFRLEYAPSNRALRLPWEQTFLPRKLKQMAVDVYHGPTFVAPLWKTCAQVVSILDMTFHLSPERHTFYKTLYFRSMIPRMAHRSDRLIAISESTKRDLIRLLGVDGDKIDVIHLGVDDGFKPVRHQDELERVRRKYDLPGKFILYLGLIEPRKNVDTLIEAYETALELHPNYHLVVAGAPGWGYSRLLKRIARSPVRNQICMPGYVALADMPALYSLADVFVYPSLYEGFGLPVLEAMASGTAVISSNISSIPEIVGEEEVVLVDPTDPRALAQALRTVLQDPTLKYRLTTRASSRAQLFTWESTARKTLAVYEKVVSGSRFSDADALKARAACRSV